jgi:hypothetical protein
MRYVDFDDGMYCTGFRLYDDDGQMFADAPTEEIAREIVDAVKLLRSTKKNDT